MEYDYTAFSIKELNELYRKNEKSIIYYENIIKNREKYEVIFVGIMFLASWFFGVLGIYFTIENKILGIILAVTFIFSNMIIYKNIDFEKENKGRLDYFKRENEKIKLILIIKENYQ